MAIGSIFNTGSIFLYTSRSLNWVLPYAQFGITPMGRGSSSGLDKGGDTSSPKAYFTLPPSLKGNLFLIFSHTEGYAKLSIDLLDLLYF